MTQASMKHKILVINTGSSSIKYQLFHTKDWRVCASGSINRIGEATSEFHHAWQEPGVNRQDRNQQLPIADHRRGLEQILNALHDSGGLKDEHELAAIGHRVVHGGEDFSAPTRVDKDVLMSIEEMSLLAPLHNPANLEGIQVSMAMFPDTPQVAVFDTAFHQRCCTVSTAYAATAFTAPHTNSSADGPPTCSTSPWTTAI